MGLFSFLHDDPQLSRIAGLSLSGRAKIYNWLIDTVAAETGVDRLEAFTAVNAAIPWKGEAMLSDPESVSRLFVIACEAVSDSGLVRLVPANAAH